MADYNVTTTTIGPTTLLMATALLEPAIETTLISKTIAYVDILPLHRDRDECVAVLVVHD